ncbi:unnamed protein product [Hyaloperonospora brassicae]|uniref:Inositol-3,4-bisphosphate 4-phosphatase n=1 Tax=Hyaloperonospora brassicae TaxID=162125 RepID=A0AAV0U2M9_HYABA|nr:unnamed protein product [Hyaloperonospora brassicae]
MRRQLVQRRGTSVGAAALCLLLLCASGLLLVSVAKEERGDAVPASAALIKQEEEVLYRMFAMERDAEDSAQDKKQRHGTYKKVLEKETVPDRSPSAEDAEKVEIRHSNDGGPFGDRGAGSRVAKDTNVMRDSKIDRAGLDMTTAGTGVTVGAGDIDRVADSAGGILATSEDTVESTVLDLMELGALMGAGNDGASVDWKSMETLTESHGLDVSLGSADLDVTANADGIRATASFGDSDIAVGFHGSRDETEEEDVDACVELESTHVASEQPDADIPVASPDSFSVASSVDVRAPVGSEVADLPVSSLSPTDSSGIDTVAQVTASPLNVDELGGSSRVRVAIGFSDDSASTMKAASVGCAKAPPISDVPATAPCATKFVAAKTEMVAPTADEPLIVLDDDVSVPDEASLAVNSTTSGLKSGRNEVVKVLSLAEHGVPSSASEIGSKIWQNESSRHVPYTPTYCRCKASECQNMYPGDSSRPMCERRLFGGSCSPGYKTCVSTDSYKVSTSSVTPHSVAEATFTLLAADIIGAFFNLGEEDPMTRKSNWWITISLPSGWRFVSWESTAVKVTLRNGNSDSVSTVRAYSCFDVTKDANCDSDTHRYGFIDVMGLLEGRTDLMTLSSGGPMSFVLSESIITGACSGAFGGSAGVSVSLSYETSSGALMSAAASRRERKLMVAAADSTASPPGLGALTLATMALPSVQEGRLDSSLLWMEEDMEIMMLSFSTSTIVGPESNNPKVCVNLRSPHCASKGREPASTVFFDSSSTVSYVKGGNPFINLYANPGKTSLSLQSDNSTYFCVTNLLPSGVKTNDSWEIRSMFTFQIQVTHVAWAGDEDQRSANASGFSMPPLGEVVLTDDGGVLGTDCAQVLVHAKTNSKYNLSVYSVMSITFYAVALAGAVLITRMNGISFSKLTFYNDMTSLSVMMIFVLCIVGNAIWIRVATNASSARGTAVYYLLYAISICFTWTMMTSVCFHWGTVLFHDVGPSGRLLMFTIYVIMNVVFYGIQLFGVISLTDFYKCAYDDYLKNPVYTMRLCSNDYCPDLQPRQWQYAVDSVCKDVSYSGWFFPLHQSGILLIFLASVALLVLGTFVIQRGVRLIDESGDIFDDHVVKVMKKSLITYSVVILSIALVLGTSSIMNFILHWNNRSIDSVVWYIFSIWLPTLVPPVGFLILQWNPRLRGMNWNPSMHAKDSEVLHHAVSSISDKAESGKLGISANDTGLSDGWAGILHFPDTEYNPTSQEIVDGAQNVLALAVQLLSPIPLTQACFVELYVAENTTPEAGGNDVGEDEYHEDLPVMSYRRSSISSFIESGIHQEGIFSRRGYSQSMLSSGALCTASCVAIPLAKWSRVSFTETVLPTLVTGKVEGSGAVTQTATFLSILQIPAMHVNSLLRFVVYEIPEQTSLQSSSGDLSESLQVTRASSLQLDERARIARVSGMGMAPPSRPKVFCEFLCTRDDVLAADEVNLVARQVSHRSVSSGPTVLQDGTGTASPNSAAATGVATADAGSSIPCLRVKSMTSSPRQLKENSGFYITKSFQFAEGDEMVIEDMLESPLTNEVPRQYLELLVSERADDHARAVAEAADYEARVKSGLVGNLYDNLIEQIQGENDRTLVQTWLNHRVQQRKMYVEALRECHQVCVERAEKGLNFKASTEKKSLVLRFLPINLHVQEMWVGPSADLRSQRSRRTSTSVRVYPTITVGAFAAHCFKFRHGGSILSLRSMLQKRSLSRVQSNVSFSGGANVVDWSGADTRSADETRWHLTTRFDMCFSQALTTLVTSFCRQLEYSLQHLVDRSFLHIIDGVGFLFQVESLLSTQGKEIGMLEDLSAAVDALKHVAFVLDTLPPSHLPSTLLNLHMTNTTLPSVVSVRLNKGSTAGTFTVVIGVRCSNDVRASIPSTIRSGGPIPVTPVVFTQGINEMQTLANNASSKKTTLQDVINRKSFFVLTRYVERYKLFAAKMPDAMLTPMSTIEPLLNSLEERITTASKRQVVKSKHPKIVQESSNLCRLLGAGRATSCKSAKDRTSMSVTLEQVRLLSENHGLPEEYVVRTVSTMRSNGVRLENALKNTGKRQYAFNSLQRSLLPDEYKCPEGTYGRGNVS